MDILSSISRLFKKPSKDNAKRSRNWKRPLKALAQCQSPQEMEELAQAIVQVGDRNAAQGLVMLVIQSYQRGTAAAEKRKELEKELALNPQALLMERLRKQTNISTIGYDPQRIGSPLEDLNEVVGRHFTRGHRALDALIGLKATEEIQALLDNSALERYRDNFVSALKEIQEASK